MKPSTVLVALAATAVAANTALAHVTIEQRDATIGIPVKLTFRVGHGCSESPTIKIRVRVPEGVIAVKPMPKSGWEIQTIKGPYEKTYSYFHGAKLSEGVKEVSWSGKLPDAYYDEFVLSGFIADGPFTPGATLYFPVVQECESGVHRWIAIPKAGEERPPEPAPGVKLLAK